MNKLINLDGYTGENTNLRYYDYIFKISINPEKNELF